MGPKEKPRTKSETPRVAMISDDWNSMMTSLIPPVYAADTKGTACKQRQLVIHGPVCTAVIHRPELWDHGHYHLYGLLEAVGVVHRVDWVVFEPFHKVRILLRARPCVGGLVDIFIDGALVQNPSAPTG